MSLHPEHEDRRLEASTLREFAPLAEAVEPRAIVTAQDFDLWIVIRHGEDGAPARDIGSRMARACRGGRDFDRSQPADWHVRARRPHMEPDGLTVTGMRTVGTEIWLSRTYAAPASYAEPRHA